MSAFMFRTDPKMIKDMTNIQLVESQVRLNKILANVEWDKLKQATFDFDMAYWRHATLRMVEQEIEIRKSGKPNTPLHVPMVPGYNP